MITGSSNQFENNSARQDIATTSHDDILDAAGKNGKVERRKSNAFCAFSVSYPPIVFPANDQGCALVT